MRSPLPLSAVLFLKWLEQAVGPEQTAEGSVVIRAVNLRKGSNAVISLVEWIGK